MPRLSLWNSGKKGNDYKFFDRTISEFFYVSGTACYIHKFLGVHDQSDEQDQEPNVTSIQDIVLLENRDRKYSDQVYELPGIYNVSDSDFDLRQMGFFLTGDTIYIEFHLNDMINLLGRKLIAGDVIELPHLRDDTGLDMSKPAIPKFYVVDEATRASDGYSTTWFPHIWRVKVIPMTGAQEYQDILDKQATDPFGITQSGPIGDLMTTLGTELGINEAIIEEAKTHVAARNFDNRQFYILLDFDGGPPWVHTGDGIPPNGAELLGSGTKYPDDAVEGDYFLRTDWAPHTLFQKTGSKWKIVEQDYRRGHWSSAHRLLEDFINQNGTSTFSDGSTAPTKQMLSQALKPRADF